MSLEVYPADFSTRYEISHAISIMLSVYYCDIGKMIIVMPIDDYNISALRNGNYVYDTERNATYFIVNVKIDTDLNRITANGITAEWRLNKRAITVKSTITKVETGVYNAINANLRGLTRIATAAPSGITETVEGAELYGGQLLDETDNVLYEQGLGRKVDWDESRHVCTYRIYKGNDLTQGIHSVAFSDEQGTAQDLIINDDISNLKTVAYVTLELSDESIEVISVGTATGDDRSEIWSKRSIRQSSDETAEEARIRAKQEAALELARNIRRQSFSVSVDPSELGSRYNLGDIVSCVSIRFGVEFTARVSGIKYTMDISGEKTQIILGEPNIIMIGGYRVGRD